MSEEEKVVVASEESKPEVETTVTSEPQTMDEVMRDPDAPVITMKKLLEAGAHFGHQTRRWNPKMKKYIYGARNGVYIIDLAQTVTYIETAYKAMKEIVDNGGKVLFVGTKKQCQEAVQAEALRSGSFYITNRWLGGTLTNFKTIQNRIRFLKELDRREEEGELDLLPKVEAAALRREREKLTFSYDEKSIYKVSKKFNINSEIVKTYLEKIKYIEDKEYRSEKLKKLLSIKKYLEEENLLIKDEIFIESLNSKEIVIYNYKFLNKFEQKIIEKLKNKTSVKFINEETNDYIHVIYKFNTLEEEITYVVNEICKLILNGISINNIKRLY